ncbi:hypothetical protein EKO27_g10252 [Xylaria grammica]|uniref:Uncharacterized protein n=1 Tax=Xylaria grammica TaxID=363999 RepID=A0A439CRQ5_9PEZI|nr:hypothetical protein EKO27_g10252 [Xylaria grammica]
MMDVDPTSMTDAMDVDLAITADVSDPDVVMSDAADAPVELLSGLLGGLTIKAEHDDNRMDIDGIPPNGIRIILW